MAHGLNGALNLTVVFDNLVFVDAFRVGPRPAELKLQLLFASLTLMFDGEAGIGRHCKPFAGDLNAERLAVPQSSGQPLKFPDILIVGLGFFGIAILGA